MAYAAEQNLAAFHPPTATATVLQRQVAVDAASYEVQRFSKAPEDAAELVDYENRALVAELRVARWMWDTQDGTINAIAAPDAGSVNFVTSDTVQNIVKGVMGDYYQDSAVAYLSRDPL